jgi:SAM-dependent methyltransferase
MILKDTSIKTNLFVCPKCKCSLNLLENSLNCKKCNKSFPIINGIPDFIINESHDTIARIMPIMKFMNFIAPIYETNFWQKLNLRLAGAKNSSLFSLAEFHTNSLKDVTGNILDIACGPITYGRRLSNEFRNVYGIDISMGILQRGKKYVEKEKRTNINLARARVEELPFENDFFNGAICSGSLHLFPEMTLTLQEIARTMKQGAPLSVQTFIAGKTIVNRALKKQSWVHNFKLEELQEQFSKTGFRDFQWNLDGPIVITFKVSKS